MRKISKYLLVTLAAVLALCSTAFAGTWKDNQDGWYWEQEDGSYPSSSWQWIDSDGDGIAESYYFNELGYLLTNTTTPDGHQVDQNGCWIVNDVIQHQGQDTSTANATEIYLNAQNKFSNLDSYDADIKIKMDMMISGMNISSDVDMSMKVKNQNANNMNILIDMRMNMLGETLDVKAFYTDGYYYMDMAGSKVKLAMPLDQFMADAKSNPSKLIQASEYLRDVQLTADGSGNQILTYTYLTDSFNEIFAQMNQMSGQVDLSGVRINEFSGSATINQEGYFTSNHAVMKFVAQIEGEPVTFDINMTVNYKNPGQVVDFILPSTDGYQHFE